MAKEMKGVHWDILKPKRRTHLMRYPWHQWMNGSTWLLMRGEDFDMNIEDFQRYVLFFGSQNDLKVRTMRNYENTGLFIKRVSANSDRLERLRIEWRDRWENQKKLGIHEWWRNPELLDDLRERRRERAATKVRRTTAPTGEPYIPGWQRLLEAGEVDLELDEGDTDG